jgi:hypothetical protein
MSLTGKRFKLWREYGALNSRPVFDAFGASVISSGGVLCDSSDIDDSDVHVIWSVLFHGRMANNRRVWDSCRVRGKPVIVLEVGGIKRGTTWKVGLNGINRAAYFGDSGNDGTRAKELGLELKPWRKDGKYILIAGQHDKSLQWQDMPRMSNWFLQTYDEIRKHTDRPIIFRPHPRCRLEHIESGLKYVYRQDPVHIGGTYDDFDMGFDNVFCTISWSSNPGIHSVIDGVPAFVGPDSLAYPVAGHNLELINYPQTPDRKQWLNDYAWTEYTTDEIEAGLPLNRLTNKLF